MRLPKRGEKGFTLIELLIVVAILGVLAAVVIPNVGRFIGRGEDEAADTEFSNVQSAVVAMMVDNQLVTLPNPVDGTAYPATANMSLFPDRSICATDKINGPTQAGGTTTYTNGSDKDYYILYKHDIYADAASNETVNYVATEMCKGTYTVDASGTVTQVTTGYQN
jgi:prepilin-type N-terminal cleavage/methylation domain-containing protein